MHWRYFSATAEEKGLEKCAIRVGHKKNRLQYRRSSVAPFFSCNCIRIFLYLLARGGDSGLFVASLNFHNLVISPVDKLSMHAFLPK